MLQAIEVTLFFVPVYGILVFLFFCTCKSLIMFCGDMELSFGDLQEEIEKYSKLRGLAAIKSRLHMRERLSKLIEFHCYLKELSDSAQIAIGIIFKIVNVLYL